MEPSRTSRRTSRRRLLRAMAGAGLLSGGMGAAGADEQDPFDEAVDAAATATGEAGTVAYPPEIQDIRAPLALNPAIHVGEETLRIELDPDAGVADPTVTIRPTFGDVRRPVDLDAAVVGAEPSDLWLDLGRPEVTVVEASLPPVSSTAAAEGRPIAPGLYDVTVEWDGGASSDTQPRSLSLRASYPEEPTVYVVSDAHAGDPRALQSGLEESAAAGDPEPFLYRFENVVGGPETERWNAFRRAVAEVSAMDPDVVLFPGDLAFGQDAPGKYYQEYADCHAMLSQLRAPVYTALGNHDGYVQGTTDGKALYRKFVGPWYWSRELWEGFRLTCVDTYDWRPFDREGVSYGVSAWGGQVRAEQLERIRDVLEAWYDPAADQVHLSMSHHSPAWRQDPGNALADEADGVPGAEQVSRGAGDYAQGGQSWRGSGRLALRELLHDVDTVLHLSGHEHRDRLSRTVHDGGAGDVVYTPTGEAALRRYDADDRDVTDDYAQADLEAALRSGSGTLFVDATTAGSETTQYWGWWTFEVDDHVDPSAFGYRPDDAAGFLEERAVEPGAWPPEHAALGRYSHPSFEFAVEELAADHDGTAVRVRNGLESARSGALLLSVPFERRPRVDGGDLLWRRVGDGVQDVRVAYAVAGADDLELHVRPRGA